MKMSIIILIILSLTGCEETFIGEDGRKYKVEVICIKEHTERKKGFHYGYLFGQGFKMHWDWQIGCMCSETICDEEVRDTILIN